jgi:hypothetical protein
MHITKRIETKIDIHNVLSFSSDKNSLLYTLAERYEGKCYRSCLITSVTSIVRRSNMMLNDVGGSIDVMFEVEGIVLQPGYIITDALVVNRASNMGIETIIATTKYANISIIGDRHLDSVKVGQYLPVVVSDVGYMLYEPKISVRATSSIHSVIPKYFKVQTDDVDVNMLSGLLKQINLMEAKCNTLDRKSWKYFDDLLYAYKKQPERAGEIISGGIKVTDLVNSIKDYKYIGCDNSVHRTTGLASAVVPADIVPCDIAGNTAIVSYLLETYYYGLKTIHDIIALHDGNSLVTHKNIWLIMNHIKL